MTSINFPNQVATSQLTGLDGLRSIYQWELDLHSNYKRIIVQKKMYVNVCHIKGKFNISF